MNLEKIKYLLNLIETSDVIVVNDSSYLHSCNVDNIIGDSDNEVIYFSWVDGNRDYSIKITEGGLNDAVIDGNVIKCEDHEGEDTSITLYDMTPKNIKIDL